MELTIDQALQHGMLAHKEGKLQDAERFYRAILHVQPEHPDANHNLGVLAVAVGKPSEAVPLFQQALDSNPQIEQFWLSYIDVLIRLERLDEANRVLVWGEKNGLSSDKLDAFKPRLRGRANNDKNKATKGETSPEKRKRLAENEEVKRRKRRGELSGASPSQDQINRLAEHFQVGRLEEAEALAASLTQQFPRHPFGWKVLGAVFQQTGRLVESVSPMKRSVDLSPDDAKTHTNLGITLQELGRLDEAEASYRQAIALKPDLAEAHSNLGVTLQELGRPEEAEASYRKAITLIPDYAEAHSNLGVTLHELGRLEEAEASYRKAITLKPDYAKARSNLGVTLQELGRLDESAASFREAIALQPDYAKAHSNFGVTLKELGRLDEAEVRYRKAIALRPNKLEAHSNLLMLIGSMLFDKTRYHQCAKDLVRAIDETVTSRFNAWSHSQNQDSLRIGFVSGDLRSHPVGYFLESLLTQLQSSSIELFAYPTAAQVDAVTLRLKPLFHAWHPLVGLNDMEAAQKIHEDGNHILIDLAGHTAGNRLPVFACKPSPIQVSWLGYFASTGLAEIDFILGDPHVTPHEEADHFLEKIWQLPESYLCFTPPEIDLEVGPLPAFLNGFITFGCLNQLSKMTEAVVSVRASILHAVPGAKLLLKSKGLDIESNRNRIFSMYAEHGIPPQRLILEGKSTREEHLASYRRVDIALSPFPYNGGTTSVEGLWMGVPVITLQGDHFVSHVSESIVHNVGLTEWIASDENDYIAKAVAFSADLYVLADLRKTLREKLLLSPVCDAERFAGHFKEAVLSMRALLAKVES